jgi:hypothetical protein
VDYLKSLEKVELTKIHKMSVDEAEVNSKKWLETLLKKKDAKDDLDEVETVLSLADGYKFVKLLSNKAYQREGRLMRHCVGSYWSRDCDIYSLRNQANIPMMTIEVRGKCVVQVQCKGTSNKIHSYSFASFLNMMDIEVSDYSLTNYDVQKSSSGKYYSFWEIPPVFELSPTEFFRVHPENDGSNCTGYIEVDGNSYSIGVSASLTYDIEKREWSTDFRINHYCYDFKNNYPVEARNVLREAILAGKVTGNSDFKRNVGLVEKDGVWVSMDVLYPPTKIKMADGSLFIKNREGNEILYTVRGKNEKGKTINLARVVLGTKEKTIKRINKVHDPVAWNFVVDQLTKDEIEIPIRKLSKGYVYTRKDCKISIKKTDAYSKSKRKIFTVGKQEFIVDILKTKTKVRNLQNTIQFEIGSNGCICNVSFSTVDSTIDMVKIFKEAEKVVTEIETFGKEYIVKL